MYTIGYKSAKQPTDLLLVFCAQLTTMLPDTGKNCIILFT